MRRRSRKCWRGSGTEAPRRIRLAIPDYSTNPQFEEARRLASRCRLRAALRACEAALREQPNNSRALALKVRLEVGLNRIAVEEASQISERLVFEDPGDSYLQVAKALLLIRGRDRVAATSELRLVAERHANDPYVHQVLAGQLGCDKATWSDAWEHWKIALQSGPLFSPAYKSAAYFLARRLEPTLAASTLSGSTRLERLVVKTRILGFEYLFDGFFALAVLSGLIGAKNLGAGVALGLVTMALGLWSAFASLYVGCWKCASVWMIGSAAMWLAFVYALKLPTAGFFLLFALLIAWVILILRSKGLVLPHERLTAELQRRSANDD